MTSMCARRPRSLHFSSRNHAVCSEPFPQELQVLISSSTRTNVVKLLRTQVSILHYAAVHILP